MVNAFQSNQMERVSEIEKGPIDPVHLLKALSPLLALDGGLKSIHEVVRLTSLMKDAKKLVSRCVYINILKTTKAHNILEKFIEVGGWEVLNSWLLEAKKCDNYPFLLELLRVFKDLPVTVNILKQNNSAKVIKTLSRGENEDVKLLAGEVVCNWMSLIKYNQKLSEKPIKKRRVKDSKGEKEVKEDFKDEKMSTIEENIETEGPTFTSELLKSSEKKNKSSRPKTAKVYQSKSRDLGLDQEARKPSKKPTVDKDRGDSLKRISTGVNKLNQPPEKKIKPINLIIPGALTSSTTSSTTTTSSSQRGGIKLIPPKPRPVHIISESTGFMSALDAPAAAPIRKKKKNPVKPPTTPPSPTVTPKLSFYTDTLEATSEADVKEDNVISTSEDKSDIKENKNEKIEDGEAKDFISEKSLPAEEKKEGIEAAPIISDHRKKKKKSVSWASEANLRQFYYFDLDETERVNVNHVKNFGDLKTLEMRRERQAFETAKRLMEDKMVERLPWSMPVLIDLPPSLVEHGVHSIERDIQQEREQRVLQEIFFSKESLPDSPHEPDFESCDPEDPKLIPLEDENNPDAYVIADPYPEPAGVSSLPPALANLVMSISNQQQQVVSMPTSQDLSNIQNVLGVIMSQNPEHMVENHMENHPEDLQKLKQILEPFQGPPPHMGDVMNFHEGGGMPPPKGLLGEAPPGFKRLPHSVPPGGPYPPQGPPPPYPPPHDMMMEEMPPNFAGPRMRHPGPGPMRNRGMMRGRGGPHMMMRPRGRNRGPERTVCKFFVSQAGCRYEDSCTFLHPGVNGPPL